MPVKMRETKFIEKATLTRKFDEDGSISGSEGGFSRCGFHQFSHPMPTTPVDEVVIRSVKWNSKTKHQKICGRLTSNMNRKIAHFSALPTRVKFSKPVVIPIHSQPEELVLNVAHDWHDLDKSKCLEGEIVIDIEFISYKKNH